MKTILLNIILVGSLLSGCASSMKPHNGCYIEAKINNVTHVCERLILEDNQFTLTCKGSERKYSVIDLRKDTVIEVCVGESKQ